MKDELKKIFAPILVVEDEEDHARLIIKGLKSRNLMNKVVHVENGQLAMDFLLKQGKFENDEHILPMLVLLDIKLPIKNGFEVLQEVKSNEQIKKTPIVMLTTTATTEDIEKALLLGANDYIVKPIKFDEFTEKVSNLGYYWGMVSDVKNIYK
jgi:DNA-binding response OmpR family regulator